jgi:hypothetical protein
MLVAFLCFLLVIVCSNVPIRMPRAGPTCLLVLLAREEPLCVMENGRVLQKLHLGVSYGAIGLEVNVNVNVNESTIYTQ